MFLWLLPHSGTFPSRIFPLLLLAILFVAIANELQDRRFTLPISIAKTSNDGLSPSQPIAADLSNENYLIYFSFDGFSNQIIGFQRAAQLAWSVNRTLVIPPVLPHNQKKSTPPPFDAFPGRKGPSGSCRDQPQKYSLCVEGILRDARAVLDGKPFPSLTNLVDVDLLRKQVPGLRVIDFPEFMSLTNRHEALKREFWAMNETLGTTGLDLDGRCTIQETRSYPKLLLYFNARFGSKRIAMIGSAFNLQNKFENHTISAQLLNFPLTPRMHVLIQGIRSKLPSRYIGVHMRFKDDATFDCASNETEIATAFHNVVTEIQHKQVTSVLVGESHPQAAPCLRAALPSSFTILTVSDMVKKHPKIHRLMNDIPLQLNTVHLLLDQLLLALADWVVLDTTAFYAFSSTFQTLIEERHRHRTSIVQGNRSSW